MLKIVKPTKVEFSKPGEAVWVVRNKSITLIDKSSHTAGLQNTSAVFSKNFELKAKIRYRTF